MIYLILIPTTLIFIGIMRHFLKKIIKKRNKRKFKEEEDKLLRDLKYLQKRLLIEPDMNVRIEIMKKIELISSIYN